MTKSAIYTRVSSEAQAEPDRYSLASQAEQCSAYAEAANLEIVRIYSDIYTGQSEDRPEFSRLLEDARAGLFSDVILLDHSRLGRTVAVSSALRKSLQDLGINLHYAASGGSYASDSEAGIILDSVSDAMSELEVKRMTRRMSSGRYRSAEAGNYVAYRAPYGYLKQDQHLVIDESTAPIVREIFSLAANGQGSRSISNHLNKRGIPSSQGAKWAGAMVSRIIRQSAYRGVWIYGKSSKKREPVEVAVPAIVSEQLWNQANEMLKASAKRARGNQKHEYLFRGRATCAECGKGFYGRTHKRASGLVRRWLAHSDYGDECDNTKYLNLDELEPRVIEWLSQSLTDTDFLREQIESSSIELAQASLDSLTGRLSKIEQKQERAKAAYLAGAFSLDDFQSEQAKIAQEKESIQETIARERRAIAQLELLDSYSGQLEELFGVEEVEQIPWPDVIDRVDLRLEVSATDVIAKAELVNFRADWNRTTGTW